MGAVVFRPQPKHQYQQKPNTSTLFRPAVTLRSLQPKSQSIPPPTLSPVATAIDLEGPLLLLLLLFCCQVVSNSFAMPGTVAHQAPLSMGSPRQEYWNGLPFPSPGGSSRPRIQTRVSALAGGFFTTEPPGKPRGTIAQCQIPKRESAWAILAPGEIATIVLVAVGSYGDTFILQPIWERQAP